MLYIPSSGFTRPLFGFTRPLFGLEFAVPELPLELKKLDGKLARTFSGIPEMSPFFSLCLISLSFCDLEK